MFSKKGGFVSGVLKENTSFARINSEGRTWKERMLWCVGLVIMVMAGLIAGCSEGSHTSSTSADGSYALIYNGPVAAEEGPEAVAAVAAEVGLPATFVSDIAELPQLLEDAAIFIIGGTEDDLDPLYNAFTPDITAALKAYLRDGGRYLGICGGGFIASTGWEEEDRFVEMLGIVPAESGDFTEDSDPQIVRVRWLGTTYPMYFQAGPTFELTATQEKVQIIAAYEDGQIAALMSSYGQGKAAVIGPHPEAPESWSEEAENGEDWISTTHLLAALLQELLSDRPIPSE